MFGRQTPSWRVEVMSSRVGENTGRSDTFQRKWVRRMPIPSRLR
jgi:hypothetical protein